MSETIDVRGTCVALPLNKLLLGVLLRGKSGSGKSDLALRLIERGASLVADDLVRVTNQNGKCIANAPDTIRGRMEIRGIGVLRVTSVDAAPLGLVVDLAGDPKVPRMPEPRFEQLAGVHLPRVTLYAFEISACAKIAIAVQALMKGVEPGVTFPFAR